MNSTVVALIVAILLFFAWYLWRTAHRIDKLHRKVVAAKIALEQQFQRRATACIDLAMSQLLDPASAMMLANEAYAVIDGQDSVDVSGVSGVLSISGNATGNEMALTPVSKQREIAESELSETLRQIFPDDQSIADVQAQPIGNELFQRVAAAWYRAELTRRFYNQAVTDARNARRHWYVRVFGLAGYAQLPETCELDDAVPPAIAAAATARQ